jgi:endoglucanase
LNEAAKARRCNAAIAISEQRQALPLGSARILSLKGRFVLKNEIDAKLSRWLLPRLRMLSVRWKRRVCYSALPLLSVVAAAILGVHLFFYGGPKPPRAAEVNTLIERRLDDAWRMYVKRFISPEGRVVDGANGDISHSEGQGYAMLIAARLKDRATFDRLWAWSSANLFVRDDQLAAWVWDPKTEPHVRDIDDASDGNILIAWALLEAGLHWTVDQYLSVARGIAKSVGQRDTEPSRYGLVLLPGSSGFRLRDRADGPIVNLSYWVFPAFRDLKHAAPTVDWEQIVASGLSVIAAARFGSDKMPTDWISLADGKTAAASGFPSVFGYDAVRIPLYLAWGRPNDRSALEVFAPLLSSAWMRSPSVIDLKTGKAREPLKENGYKSIPALLKCALYGTPFSHEFYDVQPELYYPTTLHILALLAAQDSYPSCLRS